MGNDEKKRLNKKAEPDADGIRADGDVIVPDMCSAAEIHPAAFHQINPGDNLPGTWYERAERAWNYYKEEGLVNNAINFWRVFAVGDEIQIVSDDGNVQHEAREFAERMKLNNLVKDMILTLLCTGECTGVKIRDEETGELEKVLCINPVSVDVKYEGGKLVELKQYPDLARTGEPISFPLRQVIHFRWNTAGDNERGNSMVVAAFRPIELLKDFRKAERAVAKRFATPWRFVQVGGRFGKKNIVPDQKTLDGIRDAIQRMDPRAGIVVPFYVTVQTEGTEGEVPQTERLAGEIKDEACIALGLPKSIVMGAGGNHATTKLALKKVVVQLKEIKQVARDILNWIFNEWREYNGYESNTINYIFNDLDLADELEVKKLYISLYDLGLISRETMRIKMGLDAEAEEAQVEKESGEPIDFRNAEDIIELVKAGIMSVEMAQELFGLDENGN